MTRGFIRAYADVIQKFEKRLAAAKDSEEYSAVCDEYRNQLAKMSKISKKCFKSVIMKTGIDLGDCF